MLTYADVCGRGREAALRVPPNTAPVYLLRYQPPLQSEKRACGRRKKNCEKKNKKIAGALEEEEEEEEQQQQQPQQQQQVLLYRS